MQNEKKDPRVILSRIVSLSISFICVLLLMRKLAVHVISQTTIGGMLLLLIAVEAMLFLAMMVHVVIHEAGHLVFGLATGYQFSFFRIGSLMLLKQDGKITCKKFRIAGTAGQCMMEPPEPAGGTFPAVLYNMGGSILNLVAGALFYFVYRLSGGGGAAGLFWYMMSIMGLQYALSNSIPLHTATVNNDGYNILSLTRSPAAREAFRIRMKVSERLAKGVRLKDMPEEWFWVPSDQDMRNSMLAGIGVNTCCRLMDQHRFEEAGILAERLLQVGSGMAGIQRNSLTCNLIYLELIGENRTERLRQLYTPQRKQFMKKMRSSPEVLRTEYVYALLTEQNIGKAQTILARFEKTARTYPYSSEIQAERELMELAAVQVSQTGNAHA